MLALQPPGPGSGHSVAWTAWTAHGAASAPSALLWVALMCLLTPGVAPPAVRAQTEPTTGSNCGWSRCNANQECVHGFCECLKGFVRHESSRTCAPERGFNETCGFDDQCVDFRLRCREGRCACVKYYHWDEYSKQCLTQGDLKYMLNDMREKHYSAGRVVSEANIVFQGMLWTGLAVMVIGLALASGCLFYGCCSGRLCCCPRDKMSRSTCKPNCSSEQSQRTRETTVPGLRTNTGQVNSSISQGTGVDFIPAIMFETFDVV